MSTDIALIAGTPALPVFVPSLTPEAVAQKDLALSSSALIGRVSNRAENDQATDAMRNLKSLSSSLERERKRLKDPVIEIGRQIDRVVATHKDELDRELGRIECLVKGFVLEEKRRVSEEQEAQRRELARIEAERQAELKRIADEQARVERDAREAREAAERAAREATNQKEREAAARQAGEAKARQAEADKAAALAAESAARVQEASDARAAIESKPVEITRSYGQSNRKQWKITQINDLQLMRSRPDLIRRIEWDRIAINEILNAGEKLPGVTAEEDLKVSVRGKATQFIDV